MIHKRLQLNLLLLTMLLTAAVHAQTYKAILTGRGEVPPVMTSAHGLISAQLIGDTLVVSGSFTGLSGDLATNIAGGAHIHMGYAGRNGGVIFPLNVELAPSLRDGTFDPDSNRFVLNAGQMDMLGERALYVNVHSTTFNSGELRGQIVPDADACYATVLYGSYENTLVLSQGHGALVLDLIGDTLAVSGTVNNMSTALNVAIAGGMHLHTAYAGQNGGVSIGLTVDTDSTGMRGIISPSKNTFTLTPDQKDALNQRRMYANVHTLKFPGGELRGQVTGVALAVFRAYLSGMDEMPFVPTRAGGMAIAELNNDSTLVVTGSFDGVRSGVDTMIAGGAHIHMAVAGRNGPVQFPLDLELNAELSAGVLPAGNIYALNAMQYTALVNRGLYVNVHSHQHPGGEIRGQLLPESQMAFTANLSSVAAIPAARSAAGGVVKAELTGDRLVLSGSCAGLASGIDTSIPGGAHLHRGMAGSTGSVDFPLVLRFETDLSETILGRNVFVLDSTRIARLMQRGFYVNVHTNDVPSGEIRGQVLPEASTYFFSSMAGTNVPDPVDSDGYGQVILEVHRGGIAAASGSFNNLKGDLAVNIAGGVHIHAGSNGMNGPVIIPLDSDTSGDLLSGVFHPDSNVFMVSSGLLDTLYNLGHYVNLHSTIHPSGELRGQLLPAANAHFNATLRSRNEVQPVAGGGHGSMNGILTGNMLRVSGVFADLEGDFDASVAGGCHLHGGYAGMNAGIEVGVATRLAGDLKSGQFRSDTMYLLDAGQVFRLLDGGLYVNIHTTEYASGELRGQMLSAFNDFPNNTSEITEPLPNTTVEVSSTSPELLVVSWTASEDNDSLAYIVQVAADPTFTQVAIEFNTGGQREFSTLTLAQIDTLLAGFGIPIGFPLNVYARVIASDGSVQTTGEVAPFRLLRVMPSSVRELPEGWTFNVYPVPADDKVTVELETPDSPLSELSLAWISADGRSGNPLHLHSSRSQQVELPVDQLEPGLWMLGIYDHGLLIGQRKILVVR